MRRVYLVRHGQTAWNVQRKVQGHADEPLDRFGISQAECLQNVFAYIHLTQVWSSDLVRCKDTARHVAAASKAPLILDPRLRERNFGEWEGTAYEEVGSKVASSGEEPHLFEPPGGESMQAVYHRLIDVFQEFPAEGNYAIVAHGGVCSLLLAHFLGGHPKQSRGFSFSNASVTTLRTRPDGDWMLERYNDTEHLRAPSQESAYGVVG